MVLSEIERDGDAARPTPAAVRIHRYKRLERGRFVWPQADSGSVSLSVAQRAINAVAVTVLPNAVGAQRVPML